MLTQHEIEFRVRYQETDAQGRVHHANYITYFEMGRTELMRAAGSSYRRLEDEGLMLVISEIACRYYLSAQYDDLLTVRTTTTEMTHVRVRHKYEVFRAGELIAEGSSTVACIDRSGRVRRLPAWMRRSDEAQS